MSTPSRRIAVCLGDPDRDPAVLRWVSIHLRAGDDVRAILVGEAPVGPGTPGDVLVIGHRADTVAVPFTMTGPVVVVPTSWRPERDRGRTVVLITARDRLDRAALQVALSMAVRRDSTVAVLQPDTSPLGCRDSVNHLELELLEVAQLALLDSEIAAAVASPGHPIVAEVVRAGVQSALRHMHRSIGMLVVEATQATLIAMALDELKVPVVIVPASGATEETRLPQVAHTTAAS